MFTLVKYSNLQKKITARVRYDLAMTTQQLPGLHAGFLTVQIKSVIHLLKIRNLVPACAGYASCRVHSVQGRDMSEV